MKSKWKLYIENKEPEINYVEGVRTTAVTPMIFRARIEITADFDGMLGSRGFEYRNSAKNGSWFEIDGIGKFGLREDEYKYIDDGVY